MESVGALVSKTTEEIFDTVIGSYSQVVAIGIEPMLAVIVHGGLSLLNAVIGMPLDLETTLFSIPEILLLTMAIYSIGKILQCFECTRSFTMLTYGEFERIFGYFLLITIACRNVVKVIYICEKHKLMLESLFGGFKVEWIIAMIVFLVGVFSAFAGILIFYITKTLILGLQILQLSISFLPFTSFLFEALRSGITVIMALFNLLFPRMGFAFNCAMFVIGIILLSQTSNSVEYFRVIYLESLLIPYYRFKGKVSELYKDVPTEIYKKCQNRYGFIVPVFSMEQFVVGDVLIKAHEKWWMEITEDGLYFYRKIVSASRNYLNHEGWLLFEIGHDQGEALSEMMKSEGYCQIQVIKDLAGLDRVVIGKLVQEDSCYV